MNFVICDFVNFKRTYYTAHFNPTVRELHNDSPLLVVDDVIPLDFMAEEHIAMYASRFQLHQVNIIKISVRI
jgi:hypothetical protein